MDQYCFSACRRRMTDVTIVNVYAITRYDVDSTIAERKVGIGQELETGEEFEERG